MRPLWLEPYNQKFWLTIKQNSTLYLLNTNALMNYKDHFVARQITGYGLWFGGKGKSFSDSMIRDRFGTSSAKVHSNLLTRVENSPWLKPYYEYAPAQLSPYQGLYPHKKYMRKIKQSKKCIGHSRSKEDRVDVTKRTLQWRKKDNAPVAAMMFIRKEKTFLLWENLQFVLKSQLDLCCKNRSKFSHSVNEAHCPLSSDDGFLCWDYSSIQW